MSIFDKKPKDRPYWPTFRGAVLHDPNLLPVPNGEKLQRPSGDYTKGFTKWISELSGVIYTSQGYQAVCTTENGGLGNGERKDEYPTISFERGFYPQEKETGHKKPLYLLGWLGGYEKGSILHVAWQYPHCNRFTEESLEACALRNYIHIAEILYGGREMDSVVVKFIKENIQHAVH